MEKQQLESSSGKMASAARHSLFPVGQIVPFILVTVLFFLWGIPNNLNDVLIRHFMKSFAISRFQASLVQTAFYLGYFLPAIPAALFMKRVGYKPGFIVGLLLLASGCFLVLAGRAAKQLCVLPFRSLCNRQRPILSRNRLQSIHRATRRSGHFRASSQFLASLQSLRCHDWSTDRHGLHFFRRRTNLRANRRPPG